jgi:hypothetical protein
VLQVIASPGNLEKTNDTHLKILGSNLSQRVRSRHVHMSSINWVAIDCLEV